MYEILHLASLLYVYLRDYCSLPISYQQLVLVSFNHDLNHTLT